MQSHTGRLFACAFAAAAAICAGAAGGASLDTNPAFPSYGDVVSLQLNDIEGSSWAPGTRYRLEGSTITLEIEQLTGGFFGPRPDMISLPTPVGEIAPGSYTVQARVYDMANDGAPPRLYTRTLDVAAPEAPGIYPVPRAPGAYENFQLLVRADSGIDASSVRATVDGNTVRIDFDYSNEPSARSFAPVRVPGLPPGPYRVQASGRVPNLMAAPRTLSGDFNVGNSTAVIEYYAPALDHYFISAWGDEIASLDAGTAFERTGERFRAWLHPADAPAGAVPVCRFYASGPNSHFYTADPGECQSLKSLEQKQRVEAAAKGQSFPGWQFEAIAFYALPARDGACPANTQPVYRTYNGRAAENDSNHRFMVRQPVRDAMLMGWTEEGIAFCAPL